MTLLVFYSFCLQYTYGERFELLVEVFSLCLHRSALLNLMTLSISSLLLRRRSVSSVYQQGLNAKKKNQKQFKSIKLISILETAPLQIFSSFLFKRIYYTIYFKPCLSLHSENGQAIRIHLKFLSQNDIICLINKINRLTDYIYIVKLSSVVVWTKLNSALQ